MSTSVKERQDAPARPQVDQGVMTVSSGILVVLVVAAIAVPGAVTDWVNAGSSLQSFIVITAVPVGFVLLPGVFAAPIYVRRLALEQRRYPSMSIASANHPTENSSVKETFE